MILCIDIQACASAVKREHNPLLDAPKKERKNDDATLFTPSDFPPLPSLPASREEATVHRDWNSLANEPSVEPSAAASLFADETGAAGGAATASGAAASGAAASAGTASTSSRSAILDIAPLKTGVRFRDWAAAAALRLAASSASAGAKMGEVLEALLDHPVLVQYIISVIERQPRTAIGDLLDQMGSGDFADYVKKPKRKPYWPKFADNRDTIRAFTAAFAMEVRDSGADDEEARSAYVCALSGRPRTIATMKTESSPSISFADLSSYLISTLESRETEADLSMLDAMADRAGQPVDEYGRALLEESTRVLSAHGYNDEQIRARAKQIFVRNLRGTVGDRLRGLFPETWEKALALARNIESQLAPTTTVIAAHGFTADRTAQAQAPSSAKPAPTNGQGGKKDKSKESCGFCGKLGHYRRECKKYLAKKAAEAEAETGKSNSSKNSSRGTQPPN